jgi:integrase/recombinase XerC
VELYSLDLKRLANAPGECRAERVQNAHIRRWVAQMHGAGRSGRGIALILSGWRGFYTWLGHEGLVPSNPVQDVRAPKAPKPLPKALGVDEAVQLADHEPRPMPTRAGGARPPSSNCSMAAACAWANWWAWTWWPAAQAKGWLDLQAGEAHVLGKGSKRRSVPVGRQALRGAAALAGLRAQLGGDDPALFVGQAARA